VQATIKSTSKGAKRSMTETSYELSATEMNDLQSSDGSLLARRARVPQHVVYREFVNETVVLNLQTGTYHGLNPTGGLMLQAIDEIGLLHEALNKLVFDYEWDIAQVKPDFISLCERLLERNLLELDGAG
jgi:Coenzyme PQQ synthesis protein D (PqqD)